MGVIDTLSAGFNTITKKLWLVAPPVLLDLYLLQGPRLSIVPIVRQMAHFLRELPPMSLSGVPPSVLAQGLEQAGQELNLFSLLQNSNYYIPRMV